MLDKLNRARELCLPVLVSAPAGFGKTTLVSEWGYSTGLPLSWVTLDEGDNTPLSFWRYMTAALQNIDSRIGASLQAVLSSPQTPVIPEIITGLVNDLLNLEKECILVLEDYHVIEQAEIHDSLNFLLDHLPSGADAGDYDTLRPAAEPGAAAREREAAGNPRHGSAVLVR